MNSEASAVLAKLSELFQVFGHEMIITYKRLGCTNTFTGIATFHFISPFERRLNHAER